MIDYIHPITVKQKNYLKIIRTELNDPYMISHLKDNGYDKESLYDIIKSVDKILESSYYFDTDKILLNNLKPMFLIMDEYEF